MISDYQLHIHSHTVITSIVLHGQQDFDIVLDRELVSRFSDIPIVVKRNPSWQAPTDQQNYQHLELNF